MDDRGERDRRDDSAAREKRLLEADRRTAAAPPRRFRRSRERQPVPREAERARGGERRDEHPERRIDEERRCGARSRECERDPPQGRDARTDPVRPLSDDDPSGAAEHLRPREDARRGGRRDPAVIVQEEDEEPDETDLRRDVERARDAEEPE